MNPNSRSMPTTAKAWSQLYQPLADALYLPATDSFADPEHIVIRALVVDMAAVQKQLLERAPKWKSLSIVADVIIFPTPATGTDPFTFVLSDDHEAVTFFARSIEMGGGMGLIQSFKTAINLTIYAQQIVGDLVLYRTSLAHHPAGNDGMVALTLPPDAVGVALAGEATTTNPLTAVPAADTAAETPVFWLLESTFNCALALLIDHPQIASTMLRWINTVAHHAPALSVLGLQSMALLVRIQQMQRNIHYVPVLSVKEYHELSALYLDTATSYESEYENYRSALTNKQDLTRYTNAMLGYFTDKRLGADQLLTNAQSALTNAQHAFDINSQRMRDQINTVIRKRLAFLNGVDAYKRSQDDELIPQIINTVIDFTAAVGNAAAGNPAGLAYAMKGLMDIAGIVKNVLDNMQKIIVMTDRITTIRKSVIDAQTAAAQLAPSAPGTTQPAVPQMSVPMSDDLYDNAYWQTFSLNMTTLLSPYTTGDTKIDGASEFLEALQVLAIDGQSAYANETAVIQQGQRVLQLQLEDFQDGNMQQRLASYVNARKTEGDALQKANLFFYRKLLNIKGRVVLTLIDQLAALAYWALTEDGAIPIPSLSSSVGDLKNTFAELRHSRDTALERFFPGPFDMDVQIALHDQAGLESFRTTGSITYTIPLTSAEFLGKGRCRITAVEVHVNRDALPNPTATVKLAVTSSGTYSDRIQPDQPLQFVCEPYHQPFEYSPSKPTQPVSTGNRPSDFADAYMQPTPFTTWTIALEAENQAQIDLHRLSVINLRFLGSWVDIDKLMPSE